MKSTLSTPTGGQTPPDNGTAAVTGMTTKTAPVYIYLYKADSRFAPNQGETALLCNDVSHWMGASLESALYMYPGTRTSGADNCICQKNRSNYDTSNRFGTNTL